MASMNLYDARETFLDHQRMARGLAPTSAKLDASILGRFERAAGPNASLDRAAARVEPFLTNLGRAGLGDHARRKAFEVVRLFYRWACDRGHAAGNPLRDARAPIIHARPRTFLTKAEALHLVATTHRMGGIHKDRDATIFAVLFWAGLRISEALRLRVSDADLEAGSLLVYGKGAKVRRVPIHPELARQLRAWLKARPAGGDLLFPSRPARNTRTGRLLPCRIERVLREDYAPRAGLAGRVTPHTLRRSFATELMRRGVPMAHIQALLGHADERTTRLYLNVGIDGLDASVRKL